MLNLRSMVLGVEIAGVPAIALGLVFAAGRFAWPRPAERNRFRQLRQDAGRGILLGLGVLIAADIIRTVAVDPTMESVLVLGVIVLIRTFLSMTMEMEREGAGRGNGRRKLPVTIRMIPTSGL